MFFLRLEKDWVSAMITWRRRNIVSDSPRLLRSCANSLKVGVRPCANMCFRACWLGILDISVNGGQNPLTILYNSEYRAFWTLVLHCFLPSESESSEHSGWQSRASWSGMFIVPLQIWIDSCLISALLQHYPRSNSEEQENKPNIIWYYLFQLKHRKVVIGFGMDLEWVTLSLEDESRKWKRRDQKTAMRNSGYLVNRSHDVTSKIKNWKFALLASLTRLLASLRVSSIASMAIRQSLAARLSGASCRFSSYHS